MSSSSDRFDDYSQLLELVAFAVRKEAEAAEFYRSLSAQLESPEVRDEIGKLATMEDRHRDRLERLNIAESASKATSGTGRLNLSDYETPGSPGADLSRRQLLEIAIGREVAAWKLYSDMANLFPDSMMKQLLENLAAEEAVHRQYLEKLVRSEG